MKRGQITKTNVGNMKWFAKRDGTDDPMTLSTNVLAEMYKLEKTEDLTRAR